MIKWAILFFIISLIAGFLGFTNIASGAKNISKILFFIAIVIFLILLASVFLVGGAIF